MQLPPGDCLTAIMIMILSVLIQAGTLIFNLLPAWADLESDSQGSSLTPRQLTNKHLPALIAPVVSPSLAQTLFADFLYLTPHFRNAETGTWTRPFVCRVKLEVDIESLLRVFVEDSTLFTPVRFWVKASSGVSFL